MGSARAIARLTQAHDAYRWICGGVQVNYHTLSDFRAEHETVFDGLLTASVAALLSVGVVQLKRMAQDGMREQGKKPEEARSSTTDAEATVMKMGDGGFRPAYNAQYATGSESQVIVGVEVVTVGSDMGQLAPKVEQVSERCGESPERWLVDGGYPAHNQLDTVAEKTVVYAPVPKPKDEATDPHAPKPGDSEAVGARTGLRST